MAGKTHKIFSLFKTVLVNYFGTLRNLAQFYFFFFTSHNFTSCCEHLDQDVNKMKVLL